ncbi:UDP-sugar pyrophosphorylase-like [Telopea speciosissima]|uniref:UDP-sugar pyrophosphorylase-like n=1 Tax=Telopea speciosissima TaxID=54955 RepID=UPI001CC54D59|nr:UDP-sugar pyrophosphorylase-like [Telopea speciosissima]
MVVVVVSHAANLELDPYIRELTKTRGAIEEFVNPKRKDSSKTSFKSSTLFECMMQDYPKTLPPSARVGFTVMDTWFAYAPVKNHPEVAAKVPKGNPYHSATSGEMAIYRANSLILRKAGVQIDDPVLQVFNGQEIDVWRRIIWKPKWVLNFADVKSKVGGSCAISPRSTMVLKGRNVFIEGLSFDGALIVNSFASSGFLTETLLRHLCVFFSAVRACHFSAVCVCTTSLLLFVPFTMILGIVGDDTDDADDDEDELTPFFTVHHRPVFFVFFVCLFAGVADAGVGGTEFIVDSEIPVAVQPSPYLSCRRMNLHSLIQQIIADLFESRLWQRFRWFFNYLSKLHSSIQ